MIDGDRPPLVTRSFTESTVTGLRHTVAAAVARTGIAQAAGEDFVLAVHELVINAVRHGGGAGHLELRLIDDVLTCDVADQGGHTDRLPIELSPTDRAGGRGLWLARRMTDSITLTRRPDGVTATVTVCITAVKAPDSAPLL